MVARMQATRAKSILEGGEMSERADTPFEQWAQREGIPVIRGYSVEDMYQIPLEPWERKGGLGSLIILKGGEGWTSAYLCEIPPHSSLKSQRHMFEEMIYILQGQGETKVWNEGGLQQTFSWQEYGLFAIPLNAWHQHINTGDQPVKYVAVTDAPLVFNIFGDEEFIYNSSFVFKDRYNGEKDYFDGVGKLTAENWWKGGFIPDVRNRQLPESVMGVRFGLFHLDLSNNSMAAHIMTIPTGTYKKAHKHTAGAHIVVVQGTGYAYMWEPGKENDRLRVDFKKGSLYSPPENWFHHHFNTGNEEIRDVALRRGMRGVGKRYQTDVDIKKGGDMLEYEDEPADIRKIFCDVELPKKGLECKMPPLKQ
jgi:quercetin dioxygenase-like cupin family protein